MRMFFRLLFITCDLLWDRLKRWVQRYDMSAIHEPQFIPQVLGQYTHLPAFSFVAADAPPLVPLLPFVGVGDALNIRLRRSVSPRNMTCEGKRDGPLREEGDGNVTVVY